MVLLLDEPAARRSREAADEMSDLIRRINTCGAATISLGKDWGPGGTAAAAPRRRPLSDW